MINHPLEPSVNLLKKTFPNGISEEDYYPLLDLLYEDFSDRQLAELIGWFKGNNSIEILNDIYKSQSNKKPKPEAVTRIKKQMQKHGYDEWKLLE